MTSQPTKKRRGQGATEYIIILVLVAIASISVITVFGDQIRELFDTSKDRINGNTTSVVEIKGDGSEVNKTLGGF